MWNVILLMAGTGMLVPLLFSSQLINSLLISFPVATRHVSL